MSEQAEGATGAPTGAGGNKALKSALFAAVLVGVVGVFAYLSSLDAPPDLPADGIHKFRFNTNGELVGLAIEASADAPLVEHASGLEYDKKGIEKRVNNRCIDCHGAPGLDLTSHACLQGPGCVPPKHPPKDTCIKCHRHAGN